VRIVGRLSTILVSLSLSLAWAGCASRESQPSRAERARPAIGASAHSSAPSARHAKDAAVLRTVLASDEPSDVLFTRMRATVRKSKGWQLGMSYEGWGTSEIYCHGSAVTRGACPTPGASMRSFMYGSAGAYVSVHVPARSGHWGIDANFGHQHYTMRFSRKGASGVAQPELDVGAFSFLVEHAGSAIQLDGVDEADHFARLTASPDSFRDVVLEKLDLLRQQVRVALGPESKFQIIIGHDGCIPITRELDQREKLEQMAKAERDIARRKELVNAHFREFHALVSSLVVVR
jgi:hypothetical protein